ncbi:lysophospholipase [Patescibacteria group bacterium]|nr:lysophospholipase [Patescibacteria group bacterium]
MHFSESGKGSFSTSQRNIEAEYVPETIRQYFSHFVYGELPPGAPDILPEVLEQGPFLDSKSGAVIGTRTQVRLSLSREGKSISGLLLLVTPLGSGPFPVFVSLNMYGNHSTTSDPQVIPSTVLSRLIFGLREKFHQTHRGSKRNRIDTEEIVKRKYAVATMYYGDIMQDVPDGGKGGILRLYPEVTRSLKKNNPGAVRLWASGMSSIADYLETLSDINTREMYASGHSRIGKATTSLIVSDARFKLAPVASGKGGVALSKRRFGEPLTFMRHRFPHWFSRNFDTVARNPDSALYDQDDLLSIAAQPMLVIAGSKDRWTDYPSQEDAVRRANERRLEKGDEPIEFHLYEGGHEMPEGLWAHILDFADRTRSIGE